MDFNWTGDCGDTHMRESSRDACLESSMAARRTEDLSMQTASAARPAQPIQPETSRLLAKPARKSTAREAAHSWHHRQQEQRPAASASQRAQRSAPQAAQQPAMEAPAPSPPPAPLPPVPHTPAAAQPPAMWHTGPVIILPSSSATGGANGPSQMHALQAARPEAALVLVQAPGAADGAAAGGADAAIGNGGGAEHQAGGPAGG